MFQQTPLKLQNCKKNFYLKTDKRKVHCQSSKIDAAPNVLKSLIIYSQKRANCLEKQKSPCNENESRQIVDHRGRMRPERSAFVSRMKSTACYEKRERRVQFNYLLINLFEENARY